MVRGLAIVVTLAAVFTLAAPALQACGDKFMRAGRSAKARAYASVFPASILVYKTDGTAKGMKEFESILKKAGHTAVAITDRAGLAKAAHSGKKYDLVIADYANATMVAAQFATASPAPALLPILHNAGQAVGDEAVKRHGRVLQLERMTQYDALEEIDQLMKERRRAAANGATPR